MAQTKTNQRWAEIDSVIKEHKAELKAAESHTVLRDFAKEHGFGNKEDFFKFKHSLKKIGIFYDELRDAALQVWAEELADKAKELAGRENLVELHAWTAAVEADDGRAAFAILNSEDEAIWYGSFFDNDRIRKVGDLGSAEQSVAEKAVWLAGKAIAEAGYDAGKLTVYTNYPELDVSELTVAGAKVNIVVEVQVTEDDTALRMAETPGWQSWKDSDITSLLVEQEDE